MTQYQSAVNAAWTALERLAIRELSEPAEACNQLLGTDYGELFCTRSAGHDGVHIALMEHAPGVELIAAAIFIE